MLRLTQIELLGFKSFPHKTTVDLDRGVTCVVGPNGSGKSNLADAIMFAFGSQSGHELRTARLSGLIFAGTDQLRPLNLASVTLHFERTADELPSQADDLFNLAALAEDDLELPELATAAAPVGSQLLERGGYSGAKLTRHLPARQPEEYDRTPEIMRRLDELKPGERISLTRRVFRDGTGGYFINDEPVRLKDVDQFFGRFNLGRSATFAISQGEVEKKLLETPQELRDWLAEATGVALLLQQKGRAQQKLKRTEQNLERLEDIRVTTRELVVDLAGQRVKAEEHLRLAAQLRAVELNEIRREVAFAQRQHESSARALGEVQQQLAAAQNELAQQRERHYSTQEQHGTAELELAEVEERLKSGRDELARLRQDEAVAAKAAEAARQAVGQARADEQDLQSQQQAISVELERNSQEITHARSELELLTADEQTQAGALRAAQTQLADLAAQHSDSANRSFELAQQEASLHNEIAQLKRSSEQLAGQHTERLAQLEAAQLRVADQERELAAEQAAAESLALEAGLIRDKLEQHNVALKSLAAQIAEAEALCAGLRGTLSELGSRRQTIQELAAGAEDPHGGPARLLADAKLAPLLKRASELDFPPELRAPFTRLLANYSDALAADPTARAAALSVLRGRGTEALLLHATAHDELHAASIWRQLHCAPELLSALVGMLGDVGLANSIEEADALLAAEPALAAVVLDDGTAVIGRHYALVGEPPAERALRVAQRSDVAELDRQLATARLALDEAEAQLKELRARLSSVTWERDEASSALATSQAKLNSAISLSDRLHTAVEERRAELKLLEHQTAQLATGRQQVGERLPECEARLALLSEARARTAAQLEELKGQRQAAEAALEQARTAHTGVVTRRELAQQRAEHLSQGGLDLAERASNLRHRFAQLGERLSALEQQRDASLATAQRCAAEAQELEQQLAAGGEQVARLRQRRAELAGATATMQERIDAALQAVSRLQQDEINLAAQRERASERIAEWLAELSERHGMTLTQLLADPAITASPVGAELEASEASRGKLREEKARLRGLLDELGTVNLLSIEQHQQQSARLAFMDAQAEELARAVADLRQLVGDLDTTTEQRYRSSLRHIESKFNELYLELFGSGWARLRFEDSEHLLDSGVEAEVMLPGDRRHSLRSLSGGQRSLIFIALFFAVHSVRSPGFCILDEADAALDDANVQRFVQLIRHFAAAEQFIVISHNKRTMETADRLIGVVGRPKGISNLLSVDLKEARKLVDRGVA